MSELQPCGTPAAAWRHQRYGEPLDEACRTALRRYRTEASRAYWAALKPAGEPAYGYDSLGRRREPRFPWVLTDKAYAALDGRP